MFHRSACAECTLPPPWQKVVSVLLLVGTNPRGTNAINKQPGGSGCCRGARCCFISGKPGRAGKCFCSGVVLQRRFLQGHPSWGRLFQQRQIRLPCLLLARAPGGHCRSCHQALEHRSVPLKAARVSFLRAGGKLEQEEPKPGSTGMPLCAPEGSAGAWDRLVHIVCCRGIFWSLFFYTSVILICFSLTSNSLFLQSAERY